MLFFIFYTLMQSLVHSQKFTQQDSLRGSITNERAWWDLQQYNLKVSIDPDQFFISGYNIIQYEVLTSYQILQIDLQDPMEIINVVQNDKNLKYTKEGSAYFIQLNNSQSIGSINEITVYFQGKPREAIKPPWDGGFTWKKDKNNNSFIATSNQGIGSSVWWPSKDHPYDEPDKGVKISVSAPKDLISVSNGRLISETDNQNGTKTFQWEVVNPINSYGVNLNIANYVHFSEIYPGEKGNLDCNYYVLPYNLEKAKKQFKQVPKMLKAFEHWFGPYPFYEDGYKLVEVPYLGMEHQSSITYGNGYKNGYLGRDLSGTGLGLKFDFIIIHESGHEWFANSITNTDVADMWIHEGFTTYSEVLYTDYYYGTPAGNQYAIGIRKNIKNDKPIIGIYNVNNQGSNDMYPKGASIIHMVRQMINNDEKFRDILRGMNKEYYHKIASSNQIENYLSQQSGLDLTAFFNQYLRTIKIPVLEYKTNKTSIKYRYNNIVKGFQIPIKVYINKKEKWIQPSKDWNEINLGNSVSTFSVDANFYVETKRKN